MDVATDILCGQDLDSAGLQYGGPRNRQARAEGTILRLYQGFASAGTDGNILGFHPNLDSLADNGCVTPASAPGSAACVQTHALLDPSLAIDEGQLRRTERTAPSETTERSILIPSFHPGCTGR